MKKLKQKINDFVENVGCPVELNNIYHDLHKPKFADMITKRFDKKNIYNQKNVNYFLEILQSDNSVSVDDKVDFLNMLLAGKGCITEKKLLKQNGVFKLDKLSPIMKHPVFDIVKSRVLRWKTVGGFDKEEMGAGELYFVLFGRNIVKGSIGDVNCGGKEIEIKGRFSRPRGQKGFSSPFKVLEYLRHIYGDINTRQVSFKQWENFNNVISGRSATDNRRIFSSAFGGMYTNHDVLEPLLKKYMKNILPKGLLDENSIKYLTAMQIDYYKGVEGFDYFLFINDLTFNGILIDSGDAFMEHSDKFNIMSLGLSGKEDRSSVNKIELI